MLKPICHPCHRFYRPLTNGYTFTEGMPIGNAAPGLSQADQWEPYKIWRGDLWHCEGCGHKIIVGCGGAPMAEHYQPNFKGFAIATGADKYQVNDC